jgi:hypothetical protein
MSDIQDLIHRQGVISFNTGVMTERERVIKLLMDKEALRSSLVFDGYVLYTQNGPIDISLEELTGDA